MIIKRRKMKKSYSFIRSLWLLVIGLLIVSTLPARTLDKKAIAKVQKECKKMGKELKKDGWKVFGSALVLEDELAKHRIALEEGSDSLQSIVATGEAKDINQAKRKAQGNASKQLASMRETEITDNIDMTITNVQGSEGASSSTTVTDNSSQRTKQRVKKLVPSFTLYRDKPDGKVEVQMYYLVTP